MLGYFDKVSDCSARTLIIKMKTIGIADGLTEVNLMIRKDTKI